MGKGLRLASAVLMVAACLGGCGNEDRALERERPRTPPTGADDERISYYQDNKFQVARGGRYFNWYGCGSCHSDTNPDEALNLADGRWRRGGEFHEVYASITSRHPPGTEDYARRVPVEPLWQLTAYVRDLEKNSPAMRNRQSLDLQNEKRRNQ
ncbi:hypothetical protein [Sabulicella rubraurantiaca]|uniref:hypothetical protein n=1 Tax=Sabulicella rubraurantiaca TaxID=2811429 RepID=UPI001A95B90D|nr:hypothetical protein [Sabulicella rubraurantiaca]